ncbi:MAG: glycosyltransferase family 1 protein [Candidatus Paceibacterota bacterium]
MRLIINGYFLAKPKTGMGQYLLQILLHQKWGLELIILIPEYLKKEITDIPKAISKHIQYIPIWYTRNDLLAQIIWEKFIFLQEVQKQKADIVWSPYPSTSYIPNIRHIMTVHDVIYWRLPEYIPNWKVNLYIKLLEKSISKASQIITISQFSAKEIEQIFNIKAADIPIILPSSPRLNTFSSSSISKDKYIFYEGGLDIRKNVPKLIEAFSLIANKYKDLNLYIAGKYFASPIIPNIPALVKQYNLQDRVKLLGYISDEDMVNYLKYAEALVYPSLYEGFGLPILEAFSLGAPVITSNIGAMKEVGADAVLSVNPNSAKSIAKAIESILNDDLLRQSIIHKGYERLQSFDWSKSALQLELVFINNNKS